MLPKFAVKFLKTAPKISNLAFYSTTKRSTPCEEKKKTRDWKLEVATTCDTEPIMCFLDKNYMQKEPLMNALIPGKKPKLVQDAVLHSLGQNMSIVARKCSNKEIVGVCVNKRFGLLDAADLCRKTKTIEDCNVKKLFEVCSIFANDPKLHHKLCTEKDMFQVLMLSIVETHCGQGMGKELVKKSLELARDLKFDFAKMNCTSESNRKVAECLNMQKIWEANYKDIMNRDNNKPRAMPAPPNCSASVYYIDLKTLPPKCN